MKIINNGKQYRKMIKIIKKKTMLLAVNRNRKIKIIIKIR
jgi:hypothetical protein